MNWEEAQPELQELEREAQMEMLAEAEIELKKVEEAARKKQSESQDPNTNKETPEGSEQKKSTSPAKEGSGVAGQQKKSRLSSLSMEIPLDTTEEEWEEFQKLQASAVDPHIVLSHKYQVRAMEILDEAIDIHLRSIHSASKEGNKN
jgi:hypothetical protein